MGASSSKSGEAESCSSHSDHYAARDLVDLGSVYPNGLYPTTQQDYDLRSVRNLILIRKLAPFYKGLSEPPEPVAASKVQQPLVNNLKMSNEGARSSRPSPSSCNRDPTGLRRVTDAVWARQEVLCSNLIECPICFLYYPANINYSRCCDQPLCTECFLQIKRPAEAPNSSATCPFCMQDNFGVVYLPSQEEEGSLGVRHTTSGIADVTVGSRRPSFGYQDVNVVLVDHVRPTGSRFETVRASSTNHRRTFSSFMRTAPDVYNAIARFSRTTPPTNGPEYSQVISTFRGLDVDIEEWMLMEAIRRSLTEQDAVVQSQNGNYEPSHATGRIGRQR